MLFIDVHVWTYCRNMSVVKILRVLARAGGGLRLTPPSPWHRHELGGLEEELGGFNPPNPPDNSNTGDALQFCLELAYIKTVSAKSRFVFHGSTGEEHKVSKPAGFPLRL